MTAPETWHSPSRGLTPESESLYQVLVGVLIAWGDLDVEDIAVLSSELAPVIEAHYAPAWRCPNCSQKYAASRPTDLEGITAFCACGATLESLTVLQSDRHAVISLGRRCPELAAALEPWVRGLETWEQALLSAVASLAHQLAAERLLATAELSEGRPVPRGLVVVDFERRLGRLTRAARAALFGIETILEDRAGVSEGTLLGVASVLRSVLSPLAPSELSSEVPS